MKMFYPPLYKRLVWDYSNANVVINLAVETFHWENAFYGKYSHAKVALLNETRDHF